MKTILTISGSNRTGSFNTSLIKAFHAHMPEGTTVEHMDWSALPVFSQDLEADFPESVKALKAQIRKADGIIIATPEYNRSIPGPLKNMIDWTSRPYGDSAWAKKHVMVVGATPAPTGTASAQAHLKNVLLYLDMYVLGQPEFYLGAAHEKFGQDGTLTDEDTKKLVANAIAKFLEFVG